MVCSDGLTSMVREPKLKPLLLEHDRPLDELGRELIAAANAAGGRDNITVILFTLEEVDAPARRAGAAAGAASQHRRRDARVRHVPGRRGRRPRARASAARRAARASRRGAARRGAAGRPTTPRPSTARPGTVALSAVRPRAQPIEEGHAHAPPAPPRAPPAPAASSRPAALLALGCTHRPRGRLLARDAPGLLRRRRRVPRQRRHPLPGPSVRPSARDPALLAGPALGRDAPERARRRRRATLHRSQAALQGRRREPGHGARAGTHRISERAQPRAAGADPRVAAADRRVRRDLHPALRRPLGRLADLRRDLPRRSASPGTW